MCKILFAKLMSPKLSLKQPSMPVIFVLSRTKILLSDIDCKNVAGFGGRSKTKFAFVCNAL